MKLRELSLAALIAAFGCGGEEDLHSTLSPLACEIENCYYGNSANYGRSVFFGVEDVDYNNRDKTIKVTAIKPTFNSLKETLIYVDGKRLDELGFDYYQGDKVNRGSLKAGECGWIDDQTKFYVLGIGKESVDYCAITTSPKWDGSSNIYPHIKDKYFNE